MFLLSKCLCSPLRSLGNLNARLTSYLVPKQKPPSVMVVFVLSGTAKKDTLISIYSKKLHHSQTCTATHAMLSPFYYSKKLHHSQTARRIQHRGCLFYYSKKLHHSQTWSVFRGVFYLFYYSKKLHHSQTSNLRITVYDAVGELFGDHGKTYTFMVLIKLYHILSQITRSVSKFHKDPRRSKSAVPRENEGILDCRSTTDEIFEQGHHKKTPPNQRSKNSCAD